MLFILRDSLLLFAESGLVMGILNEAHGCSALLAIQLEQHSRMTTLCAFLVGSREKDKSNKDLGGKGIRSQSGMPSGLPLVHPPSGGREG